MKFKQARGFTLIELMVVITIIAISASLVLVAMPNAARSQLEQEAQRLHAHLDLARHAAQGSGIAIKFETNQEGFSFKYETSLYSQALAQVADKMNDAANGQTPQTNGNNYNNSNIDGIGNTDSEASKANSLYMPPEIAQQKPWLNPNIQIQPTELILSPEPLSTPINIVLTHKVDTTQSIAFEVM